MSRTSFARRTSLRRARRRRIDAASRYLFLAAILLSVAVLAILLWDILRTGLPRLNWPFLTSYASRLANRSGIAAPLVGSLYVIVLTAAIALPVGVSTAIFLEFYAEGESGSPLRRSFTRFLGLNIDNLAGVPSIVYGLFGLAFFVRWLHFDRSVLSAALTLALMVLPVIIVNTREAMRAVPPSLAHGAYALGASKTQVIFTVVLPAALGGILTGTILSVSRALGESAPLLAVGAWVYVTNLPRTPLDSFTVLPVQIYYWSSMPQPAFREAAAAAIIVLLVLLLSLNGAAIWLRGKYQKKAEW